MYFGWKQLKTQTVSTTENKLQTLWLITELVVYIFKRPSLSKYVFLKGENYGQSFKTEKQLDLIQISMYLVKSYLISVVLYRSPVLAVFRSRSAFTIVRTIVFHCTQSSKMIEKFAMERTSGGLWICTGDWNAKKRFQIW